MHLTQLRRTSALVTTGAALALGLLAPAAFAEVVTPVDTAVTAPAAAQVTRAVITVTGTADFTPCVSANHAARVEITQDGGAPLFPGIQMTLGGGLAVRTLSAGFDSRDVATKLADGIYQVTISASCDGVDYAAGPPRSFIVDNTAPELGFTAGPAEAATLASGTAASFGFAAADANGPVTYLCSYDGAALAACVSPTAGVVLGAGAHGFRVVATDAAGNASAVQRGFSVATAVVPSEPDPKPVTKPRCRVPNLRGLTLVAAKRKLTRAHCRIGRVTKPPKRVLALGINRGQRLVVQRQTARAGVLRPNGQRVGVALVPRRDLKLG